jgi:hypothetical protein
MIGALICWYNIFCHIDNIRTEMYNNKYPKDVAELCYYFEGQKAELPEYCFFKSETFIPRRRSEF